MQSKLDIRQASTQSKHAIEVRGWTLLSSVQPWQIVQPRRWQHAHLYTEDHHKVFPAALVQSSIVRIWGQAQGPLAAPLHDVLHSRVPLRAAPLPRHVVLVRDLEWPGATNDEARRKWLGMWLGTWFFSRHEAKMALRHEAKMATGCLTGMVTIINHQHVLGV